MKIGIIGSGTVAQSLASALVAKGHFVMISSRTPEMPKDRGEMGQTPSAHEWQKRHATAGKHALVGSFTQAAEFGEVVFNCTTGMGSMAALQTTGDALRNKILIDVANPLDFSRGMPPTLAFCNTESLGERIQSAFPDTKVVKTLNTVNAELMVAPSKVKGDHTLFIAGNDAVAKKWVQQHILSDAFGWKHVLDLGDISASRGTEMYLPLWLRMWGALNTPHFNVQICHANP